MQHKSLGSVLVLAAVVVLAGCGEKVQTAQTRKSDTAPYQGAADGYSASGWKAGDQASWEQQIRTRAQGQNEYTRAAAP